MLIRILYASHIALAFSGLLAVLFSMTALAGLSVGPGLHGMDAPQPALESLHLLLAASLALSAYAAAMIWWVRLLR